MREGMTHEKHRGGNLNLTLWTIDCDDVGREFLVGKADARIGFRLNIVNKYTFLAKEGAVVSSRNGDRFVNKVLVLEHA